MIMIIFTESDLRFGQRAREMEMAPVNEPRIPGWYPDPSTRGTKYWDGMQWTGDKRPPRKPFAAASAHRGWGIALTILGVLFFASSPNQFAGGSESSTSSPIVSFLFAIILGIISICAGIYLLRGQGPSTKVVQRRISMQTNPHFGNATASPAPNVPLSTRDCSSCGAQVTGMQGSTVNCSYCDSLQQIQ